MPSGWQGGLPGVIVNDSKQPWFGLPKQEFETWPVSNYQGANDFTIAAPVDLAVPIIERFPNNEPFGVRRYGAVFGYNRDRAIMRGGDDNPLQNNGDPVWGDPYGFAFAASGNGGTNYYPRTCTPWPSALRITMRLHDSRNVIDGGREFQFVVPIPSTQ